MAALPVLLVAGALAPLRGTPPLPALPAFPLDLPRLSHVDRVGVSLVSSSLLLVARRPRQPAVLVALACVYVALCFALRQLRRHASLLDPHKLATRESRFAVVDAQRVHYIEARGAGVDQPSALVHMNHGFGASCLSFLDVIGPLANAVGGVAVAHDRAGFGLTERPADVARYTFEESRALARELLATVATARGLSPAAPRVLLGHSMGAYLSVLQALEDPKVVGLVLVAPALPAGRQRGGGAARANVFLEAVALVVTPLVVLLLRVCVYSRIFWARLLSASWYSAPAPATVERYRRPSLAKGWDTGMLKFVLAMVQGGTGRATAGALRALGVPVLIVHGREDRLVPVRASRGLRKELGDAAALVELDACGHVPHEECPERFLQAVVPWVEERLAGKDQVPPGLAIESDDVRR